MKKIPFDWEVLARYTAGDCTAEEADLIDRWRQADPDNEKYLDRFRDVWLLSGDAPDSFQPDTLKAWDKVKTATVLDRETIKIGQPVGHSWGYYVSRIAAVLIIGVLLFAILGRNNKPTEVALTEKVSLEASTAIQLADGSKVWLNAGSKLNYPQNFDGNTREVYLEGEGYFEVAHNPEKPFIIHAANTLTKVLGTSFNVKAYQKDTSISVAVNTGKVSFQVAGDSREPLVLTPGEQGVWVPKADQLVEQSADLNALAWHTKTLVFKETNIKTLGQILKNHFGVSVQIENNSIGNCHFTGTFKNANLTEIMEALKISLGIEYKQEDNQILISGNGC